MILTNQGIQITDKSYSEITEAFILRNITMFDLKTGNDMEQCKQLLLDLLLNVDKDYRDTGRYNSTKKNLNK